MWLNEEARINSKVANINQLLRTDGFTFHSKDAVMNTFSFFKGRAEYTHRRNKPVPSGVNLQPFDCSPAL